jgi:hypothetical protein
MRHVHARRLLLAALGIGIAAEILLFGSALGINVPILVALLLATGWLVRRRGRAPDPLDAWLPAAALVFASGVAIRADPFLALLDGTIAAACVGASLVAFSGLAVTRRSASVVLSIGAWVMVTALAGATQALTSLRAEGAPPIRWRVPAWLAPVVRGLVLAIPLALIFAVLFSSADPIFRRGSEDVLGLRIDLGDLPGRLLFTLAAAWLAAGLLSVAVAGVPPVERSSLGAAAQPVAVVTQRSLGTTEAVVVLLGVDLVFATFVGLQVAYLFGGLDTLAAAGMTYSDYARRGYFELVAAAGIAGGLLVALEYTVRRRSRAYVALGVGLVGLTVAVLASAALRLQLYQDAYGWTELRLYVAVSIVAMAVTLGALAIALLADRTRWLGHVMAVTGLAALLALNVLAPGAFVAQRNVERFIDPSLVPPDGWVGLDVDYLSELPDDAIPVLVEALPRLPEPQRGEVAALLAQRERELATNQRYAGWPPANLGRYRAREALETLP